MSHAIIHHFAPPPTLYSLDVLQDTSTIVFNTAKLGLTAARVSSTSLKQEVVQESSAFAFDEDNERATIKLPTTLAAGSKVTVKIDFDSELTGSMMGYYRSSYEVNGKTEHYTLTQFEVCSRITHISAFILTVCSPRQRAEPSRAGTSPCSRRPSP